MTHYSENKALQLAMSFAYCCIAVFCGVVMMTLLYLASTSVAVYLGGADELTKQIVGVTAVTLAFVIGCVVVPAKLLDK